MYTVTDYATKKAMKEAVAAGEQVGTYQPGGLFPPTKDGWATIEGPHYPKPHKWYARVQLKDGLIVRVK